MSQPLSIETRKRLLFLCSALVLATALILFLLAPVEPHSFSVPSSNGYDEFLKAAEFFRGESPSSRRFTDTPDAQAVRKWMFQHAEGFSLVEAGLSKECVVVIRTSTNYVARKNQDLANLKHLTHCMIARAEIAEADGRTSEMFDAYLKAYRFAQKLGRGGLYIDWLQQVSCEVLVLQAFVSSIPVLSSQQCMKALAVIQKSQAELENPALVMRRTRAWEDASYGSSTTGRARFAVWFRNLEEALRGRSLDPLRKTPYQHMLGSQQNYQKIVRKVCDPLQERIEYIKLHSANDLEGTMEQDEGPNE